MTLLIRCTESLLDEEGHQTTSKPLSVFIPSTTPILHDQIPKQLPSPTNSSSRSTVVRSQSSSDVESPNEQILTRTLIPQETVEQQTVIQEQQENQTVTNEDPTENKQSPSTDNSTTTTPNNNNEDEDDYIKCSLETVYTSTEMALSPPQQRPSTSQQTDNQYTNEIIDEFVLLKNQYEQSKEIQHDLVVNYHQTILKVITSLQQANQAHQEQIDQYQSDIANHIQDNETLKVC